MPRDRLRIAVVLFLLASPGLAERTRAQAVVESAGSSADLAISAISLVGVPYRYGGSDPATGLDCSGLVQFVARITLGLQLPRQAEAMSRVGTAVGQGQLRAGDLVFFNTLGRAFSHVGVYLGEDQFVHAPTQRGQVRIEAMAQPYWAKRYNGARRLVTLAEDETLEPSPAGRARAADDPLGLDKP